MLLQKIQLMRQLRELRETLWSLKGSNLPIYFHSEEAELQRLFDAQFQQAAIEAQNKIRELQTEFELEISIRQQATDDLLESFLSRGIQSHDSYGVQWPEIDHNAVIAQLKQELSQRKRDIRFDREMLNSDFERRIRDENKRFEGIKVSENPQPSVDRQAVGALSSEIDRLESEYRRVLSDSRLVAIFDESQDQVKSALDQSLAEQKRLLGQVTSETNLSCRDIYEQRDSRSQSFQRKQGEVRGQLQSLRSRADGALLSESRALSEEKAQKRTLLTQKIQQIETLTRELADTEDRDHEEFRRRVSQYDAAFRALEVAAKARVDVSDLDKRIAAQTNDRDLARRRCEGGGQREQERSEIERLESVLAWTAEQLSQGHRELKAKRQARPDRSVREFSRLGRLPSLKARAD
jgi:hypothetical protein